MFVFNLDLYGLIEVFNKRVVGFVQYKEYGRVFGGKDNKSVGVVRDIPGDNFILVLVVGVVKSGVRFGFDKVNEVEVRIFWNLDGRSFMEYNNGFGGESPRVGVKVIVKGVDKLRLLLDVDEKEYFVSLDKKDAGTSGV